MFLSLSKSSFWTALPSFPLLLICPKLFNFKTLCFQALQQMANDNNGTIVCPRSRQTFNIRDAEKVFVMWRAGRQRPWQGKGRSPAGDVWDCCTCSDVLPYWWTSSKCFLLKLLVPNNWLQMQWWNPPCVCMEWHFKDLELGHALYTWNTQVDRYVCAQYCT